MAPASKITHFEAPATGACACALGSLAAALPAVPVRPCAGTAHATWLREAIEIEMGRVLKVAGVILTVGRGDGREIVCLCLDLGHEAWQALSVRVHYMRLFSTAGTLLIRC